MSWCRRLFGRREAPRVADVSDPAVAAAMRIMQAESRPDLERISQELIAAKMRHDAATGAEREAALVEVGRLSFEKAVAEAARRKFGGD
ncbi:hypothetical protein GCM10011360_08220 [Primorskyibacter flagellatus]|uniref:Uncharacterized protein n=1 Tax=Primorskyibacter flagellatus TaxID=1387277 RepID=A0A917A192_9RHOB|nr:hypothetical protein [Primorskyibacter flagellatus]GGE22086.1 hypothetical protein GCM10011360_08220 [Primorskyibacter flagellatus]